MQQYSIAISSRQRGLRFDRRRLVRLARSVLRGEGVAAAQISVVILDDPQVHAINRQFLNHDYPTDVISFLLDCSLVKPHQLPNSKSRGAAKVLEGEIVISAETAAGN